MKPVEASVEQQSASAGGAQTVTLEAIQDRIAQLTKARQTMSQAVVDNKSLKVYLAVEQRLLSSSDKKEGASAAKAVTAPSLAWIREALQTGVFPVYYRILEGYLVDSASDFPRAQQGDVCISVVVPERCEISSDAASERYEARFPAPRFKPCWFGRVVHIRFFYPGETIQGILRKLEEA